MNPPVAPELFDVLSQYAKDIEDGKIKPGPSIGATSPALTFCENFYAQFFQNRMGHPIEHFNLETKKAAVRLRLEIKDQQGPKVIVQLITWFEKLCDMYSSLLALGYGVGSKATFFDFHNNYLLTLLDRAAAWGEAEGFVDIQLKAKLSSSQLKNAMQSIPK